MHTPTNLLGLLDKCPPFLVFALARRGTDKRPKFDDIVKASGLSERTFIRIACRFSWREVKVKHIDGFCRACGVDPFNLEPHLGFLRRSLTSDKPFAYMTSQQLARFNDHCSRIADFARATVSGAPSRQSQSS